MSGVTSYPSARGRARLVTYGVLAVMALAVRFEVEAWPVTSYRLFSNVRTSTQSRLVLYAVDLDGVRTKVDLAHGELGVLNTRHQLADVGSASPQRQREMVLAWLRGGGIEPADVTAAVIERVRSRISTDGDRPTVISRTVVVVVLLR